MNGKREKKNIIRKILFVLIIIAILLVMAYAEKLSKEQEGMTLNFDTKNIQQSHELDLLFSRK